MPRLSLPQTQAYLSALFTLARHGNTFATEANAMIRDVSHKEVVAGEFFAPIHSNPSNAFESALQQTAKRLINQDR